MYQQRCPDGRIESSAVGDEAVGDEASSTSTGRFSADQPLVIPASSSATCSSGGTVTSAPGSVWLSRAPEPRRPPDELRRSIFCKYESDGRRSGG